MVAPSTVRKAAKRADETGSPKPRKMGGHRKTSTLVAGMRSNGAVASRAVEGATERGTFLYCVEECPAPTLKPGAIIVMDNPGKRKSAAVREAIEETGAELRLRPPCSPDLNLIEIVFAKLGTGCGKPRSEAGRSSGKGSQHP